MARQRRNISSAKPQFGNNVPFSIKKTRRQFKANMQNKRIFVPEYGRTVRVRVSTSELKTIDKIGLRAFLERKGMTLKSIMEED
ncbi:MAG: 50S ribosomal protein L28 [Anaerolineae bacterium]